MRKVHYTVMLDVFVHEYDDADGVEALMEADFRPENNVYRYFFSDDKIDIIDVTIKSVKATNSR